jgi:hypothetical protein
MLKPGTAGALRPSLVLTGRVENAEHPERKRRAAEETRMIDIERRCYDVLRNDDDDDDECGINSQGRQTRLLLMMESIHLRPFRVVDVGVEI